jgi:hypothetical protein
MTKENATPTLAECQYNAVLLAGIIDAIDFLDNDGQRGAMTSIIAVARERAVTLADNLDNVKLEA